jgi:hypothetical protein
VNNDEYVARILKGERGGSGKPPKKEKESEKERDRSSDKRKRVSLALHPLNYSHLI